VDAAAGDDFVADNVYPRWQARVEAAETSVRVYSPYFDDLIVRLLGRSPLPAQSFSVVTDLSPMSGTLSYRKQLLAARRLLKQGFEVRSLARLHAKVLLIDGTKITVGSQNFTSYARESRETTTTPDLDMSDSRFVETLERWYDEAEPVDPELIDTLLTDLRAPFNKAQAAIEALANHYDGTVAAYRDKKRQEEARKRLALELAKARSASPLTGFQRAVAASRYTAGQSIAYAELKWDYDGGYNSLERMSRDIDLTYWRERSGDGKSLRPVVLDRLDFYPALLAPRMTMAFVRVGVSRITYVWRGVSRSSPLKLGVYRVWLTISFLDDQPDSSNLLMTLRWREDLPHGCQVRFRFDGTEIVPVAEFTPTDDSQPSAAMTELLWQTYNDPDAWTAVLKYGLSRFSGRNFLAEKEADTFFPHGRIRITHTQCHGQSVLLFGA